jgi:hypothetical protein
VEVKSDTPLFILPEKKEEGWQDLAQKVVYA